MNHTPGPWRISKSNQGKIPMATQPPAIKAGKEFIAVLGGGSIHFANAEANAEFIVRACNSHDDLLEAAKLAREYIAWSLTIRPDWKDRVQAQLHQVEAAIARATE